MKILRYLSQLLRSIWLFFPGFLFILFTILCFWMLGQGKDILVAFTENKSQTLFSLNYTRIIFFLSIAFWVYVSWYSSRIISYIQRSKQIDTIEEISGKERRVVEEFYNQKRSYFEIGKNFLEEIPRIIGNACFLVLELAVLQSPVLTHPLPLWAAWVIFFVVIIGLRYLNKWIERTQASKKAFHNLFWILFWLLIVLIIISSITYWFPKISMLILFALLILFHLVFIVFIHLRRVEMEAKVSQEIAPGKGRIVRWIMDYFCIPNKETSYVKTFIGLFIVPLLLYIFTINFIHFAQHLGPFPVMLLAFGFYLFFGNIVTAFSVRYKINFHFLLFLLVFVSGVGETHYVRTLDVSAVKNNYDNRPQLYNYLTAWLNKEQLAGDSTIYFIMSNGGASRSGYWTASVLGRIEDSSLAIDPSNRFSDHIFCLSGTSGGGVGVATFFSLLRNTKQQSEPWYENSGKSFLKRDYFTYTFARLLGPDVVSLIFHILYRDRAAALEMSFEDSTIDAEDSIYQVPFYDTLSKFPALKGQGVNLPILCINSTRMQDGNPGVVSNLVIDSATFNNRVDILKLLGSDSDITITSGSILGARFPYLSPAGRIKDNYFVDGGYFDNSGAGVVQEMIRGILNIAKRDSMRGGSFYKKIQRLHFKVLHIVNSEVDFDSSNIKKVAPIKNDLLAPILTIVGAYNMQTTVNDGRLINFIKDIDSFSNIKAEYIKISLYKDSSEWRVDPLRKRFDKEPPYAMNWFMSDTTLKRIDNRLETNPTLRTLLEDMKYK